MNIRSTTCKYNIGTELKRLCLYFLLVLVICTLSACLIVEDKLVINKDGSGTIILECQSDLPEDQLSWLVRSAPFLTNYPPLDESQFEALFPGDDFTIETETVSDPKLSKGIRAKIEFSSIDALLNSPYAQAKSLEIVKDNNTLRIRSLTGVEALALFAAGGQLETNDQIAFVGNALLINKDMFSSRFTVSLPEADDGQGKIGVSSEKVLNFADQGEETFRSEAFKPLVLSCPADSVSFSVDQSARLSLDTFDDLEEKTFSGSSPAPSAAKLKELVEFIPTSLALERSFLFSGDYSSTQNAAKLSGNLVVSYTPAPVLANGKVHTTRVVDGTGTILPPMDEGRLSYSYGKQASSKPGEFPVSLSFQPPEWGVEKIQSVSGEIDFKFMNGLKIVKAGQVISADNVTVADENEESRRSTFGREETVIYDEKDMVIELGDAEQSAGTLRIQLYAKCGNAEIKELQVFDSKGKAWPAIFIRERNIFSRDDRKKFNLLMPGTPELPLSLAFLTSAGTKTVTVPFEARDLSCISDKKPVGDTE